MLDSLCHGWVTEVLNGRRPRKIGTPQYTFFFFFNMACCTLKPILHCDAKLLALGNFVLPNAKDSTFAIPNARNTNMLVSLALGDANFSRFTRR